MFGDGEAVGWGRSDGWVVLMMDVYCGGSVSEWRVDIEGDGEDDRMVELALELVLEADL